jgi:4'-phosphopantetheinyl transferase
MNNAWQRPPRNLQLSADLIDVWKVPLNLPPAQVRNYRAVLSREEQQRCDKFKSEKRRREFIIGRGLLRTLMGQCLEMDPSVFEFAYTEHQKPYLPVAALGVPITFNISHSRDLALVALALERHIGIDIEYLRPDVDFKKLAGRFFSERESRSLEAYHDVRLTAAFFACWTRKEALLKAIGEGIAFGLGDFSVAVDPQDRVVTLHTHWDEAEAARWSIVNLDLNPGYAAAVAASGAIFKLRCWDLFRTSQHRW